VSNYQTSWTIDQIVANFRRGTYAQSYWSPATITYGFATIASAYPQSYGPEPAQFSPFTSDQQQAAIMALELWTDVANIVITPAADGNSSNIRFANTTSGPQVSEAFLPQISGYYSGDVWVNPDYLPNDSPLVLGGYGFITLLHEIGHALGLPHPGDYNEGDGATITYQKNALYQQDTRQYTVMSYFDASNTGAHHNGFYASTPLLDDIAAMQYIYGANTSTRAGDTVYGYNTNITDRPEFDFTVDTHPIIAIWDGGGNDTIDLSGSGQSAYLDLNQGAFSNVLGLTKNLAIAYGAQIENGIGGSGSDTIIGNELDNQLTGNAGDDTLNGNDGNDTLTGGAGNDVLDGGIGNDQLDGGTGNDLLTGDAGNDLLMGGSGNDTLNGGTGNDLLYGGPGNDVFYVDTQADIVFENPGEGTDTVIATASFYMYDNIENLTLAAGAGDIFGSGNASDNIINGNEGNNLLLGWDGNDTIFGNDGNDILYGVNGDDALYGGAGVDYLIAGDGNDYLDGGSGADALYGENGNDTLYGGTGFYTDILVGGAGNDILDGSADPTSGEPRNQGDYDLMYGGTGDDTYYVDTPADLTFENPGEGTDTVYADINGAGYYLYANVENLTLLGTTPFGVGNELDNVLIGNSVSNYLLGGDGNDTLDGKGGNDVLFGQGGADTFVFEPGTGADLIGDFDKSMDRIELVGTAYHSFSGLTAANALFENNGSSVVNLGAGDLVVVSGVTGLSASNFFFA